jgi:UDP-GlcNAc:undecaprenyl-phosphate/decaprenyl-phosphate GlcNAc-1-phosphate transferase
MSPLLLIGLIGGLALVLTAVLTPVVRGAAMAGGMVRQVQADRWHKRPTPAIGGVAIFLGFGLAVGAGYLLESSTTQGLGGQAPQAFLPWTPWEGLVMASTVAFLVGLVDDFIQMRPLTKLLGQLVAAFILLASGIGLWLTGVYAVDAVISLIWFIGITNALNLLDNMDGVAAGVAAIAAAYLAVLFALEGESGLVLLAVALSASLLGFLAHNYPPARIFMGDSGSLFVGLALSGLALAPAPGGSRSLAAVMAAPVLILGVPILDTTIVTIGRLLEGRPVSRGGRDHTAHRFVDLGLPERRTAWLLWGLAAVGGAVGVLLRSAERGTALVLGGVLVAVLALTGAYLLSVRLRALENEESEALSLYRWLIRSQSRYPILAVVLDGVWISLAYYSAYLIRWSPNELPAEMPYFQRTVIIYVGVKMIALILSGVYDMRWASFGLFDGLRMGRANLFATLLAAVALFLLDRVGLSRGVIAIDFFVCTLLTTGGRLSFRMIEGTAKRWSEDGRPVVVLTHESRARVAEDQLDAITEPKLRAVAIASPEVGVARARVGPLPLYGGQAALRHALEESGASAIVVLGDGVDVQSALDAHLASHGGVDVYRLEVTLRAWEGGGGVG